MKVKLSRQNFEKNTQISNVMKILPLGTQLFHADRRTDGRTGGQTGMTKLIIAFSNFVNAPKTIMTVRLSALLKHSYKTGTIPHRCSNSAKIT
jgi:hypothetical protein